MSDVEIDKEIGEYLIKNEAEIIERFIGIFEEHFRKNYATKSLTKRAIHAKSHGCLRATFEVLDHKDESLSHGIFKAPRTFEAVVRVSNGDGPPGRDNDKHASIGFAMKVRGVEEAKYFSSQTENSQDFLFINQPAYLAADVRDYEQLMRAINGCPFQKGLAFLRNFKGLAYRRKALPKDDPLNTFFWSGSPFRLGDTAVKYLIRPREYVRPDKAELKSLGEDDPDYLTKFVREHIAKKDVAFDFYLQKRLLNGREDKDMPIEDFSVIWDEATSVPVHVAELRIPRQEVDAELDKQAEHFVYSLWNTAKDFRPLGSLNRARKVVYSVSSRIRHQRNQQPNPLA